MTALRRAILFTALAMASLPTLGVAQGSSTDSLVRRIDSLEHRIAALELRVEALQAFVRAKPAQGKPVPAPADPRNVTNWRKLSRGMTMDEVRGVLGEPASVVAFPSSTSWKYPSGGFVEFGSDDNVEGWMEPIQSTN